MLFFAPGKLQHKNNAEVKNRHVVSKNNIIIPIYTVYVPALDQVIFYFENVNN
jgi:hypothetical protein